MDAQEVRKNVQKFTKGVGSSATQPTDTKAFTSERRKVQMKWCEQQRVKLQEEVKELQVIKNEVAKITERMLHESEWILKMKAGVMKQLQPGECDNALPDWFGGSDYPVFHDSDVSTTDNSDFSEDDSGDNAGGNADASRSKHGTSFSGCK